MAHTNQLNEFVINSNIQNGTIVGNRYELVRPISSGSFGDVWEAFDLLNGHLRVAVKLLHAGRSASEVRTRFARECSALELLIPNQHVVAIRERGIHVDRDYMVMELLEGPTLKEWLHGGGATKLPDVAVVISILEQLCEGVAAAHSVKSPGPIVHRDLKPENIILLPIVEARQPSFQAKILDFGLARLGDSRISFLGQQLGTVQVFLFHRRCIVLRQRRLGIGKGGRQVGRGRDGKRAVRYERTFTPHRNGSQSDDPFSSGLAP